MNPSVEMRTADARTSTRGGAGAWEGSDDLCPSWWPRRRPPPRRALRASDGADLRAADRIYVSLTLVASTFQFSDEDLAREVRAVALAHVVAAAKVLTLGAGGDWEHADDVCPAWPGAPAADGVAGELPLPGRASYLLDLLALLHAFSLAARLPDAGARAHATTAIGQVLLEQATSVARAFR